MDITISLTGFACGGLGSGELSRSRGRWSRSLRPAMVPPARPYLPIAAFRELRVLALLAAASATLVPLGTGGARYA